MIKDIIWSIVAEKYLFINIFCIFEKCGNILNLKLRNEKRERERERDQFREKINYTYNYTCIKYVTEFHSCDFMILKMQYLYLDYHNV